MLHFCFICCFIDSPHVYILCSSRSTMKWARERQPCKGWLRKTRKLQIMGISWEWHTFFKITRTFIFSYTGCPHLNKDFEWFCESSSFVVFIFWLFIFSCFIFNFLFLLWELEVLWPSPAELNIIKLIEDTLW